MRAWWRDGDGRERTLELILRVGVAGCFIGHGAFGILGKEGWLPYFAVFGIPESWAWLLMPVVGSVDIAVGILALLTPRPAVLAYAAAWALLTALLRPLAGESVFEALERAGNYGIPLAFLAAAGVRLRMGWEEWLRPARVLPLTEERLRRVGWALRGTLALLLVGHGGLAFTGKELLADHMAVAGLDPGLLGAVGLGEMVLGVAVAWRPAPALLVPALGWKLVSEALYPVSGAPFWEFVERAGSYAAPAALLALSPALAGRPRVRDRPHGPVVVRGAVVLLGMGALAGAYATSAVPVEDGQGVLAQDTTLLAELRGGGLVLACRHAVTDRSRGDRRPVDYDDPSTQRVLSEEGREQARELGRVLRELEVPIGEVLTSPYARTEESAELAFGRSVRSEALVYGNTPEQRRERRRLLAEPTAGGNRVLMTHQGILYDNLPTVERGSIREGDCVVVRPGGEEYEALARLGPEELRRLGEPGRLIDAVRTGGTSVVCRHAITRSMNEREPVSYEDPSTQRLLSAEGERQSRRMGDAFRALGIRFDEVVASPMQRARRTAELMGMGTPVIDSIWHTNDGNYQGPNRDARLRVLTTPAPGNRLVVSHIGTMTSVLPEVRGRLEEGDCAVVRPEQGGFTFLGVVPWEGWLR